MVFPNPNGQVFQGGQMTDLPEYDGPFDPTALIEIVAPGNEAEGVNYSLTLLLLAQYLIASIYAPTIIEDGATIVDPYEALVTDQRLLVNKTVGAATYIDLGSPADRVYTPIMVRDLKGDAESNNITVSFNGTVDGLASPIVISTNFGGYVFNPLATGNWYLTTC